MGSNIDGTATQGCNLVESESLKGCDSISINTMTESDSNAQSSASSKIIMDLNGTFDSSVNTHDKRMPWIGLDIGGTLVKVVFFDPDETFTDEVDILGRARTYLNNPKAYGVNGRRDEHLEMPNCIINKRKGTLHFIRFPTSHMMDFIKLAKDKGLADLLAEVCATGGGAYKFEQDLKDELNIILTKTDELDSLIYGIHYVDKYNPRECFFLSDPLDDARCKRVPFDFSEPYPYLVVNIGSGVSILAVYSPTKYCRVWGSNIGGGTFEGLCSLLTQSQSFDQAISMAEAGSASRVDKLVKDIYGGDYEKFNLSGDLVASSFGSMTNQERRAQARPEDLARAVLEMVTTNIAALARHCACIENIDRVVFVGNFLRVNQLSMKLLSSALEYWTAGKRKALFLEHEGYFGCVGCLVESTQNKSR